MSQANRRVTWVEILVAVLVAAAMIAAEGNGALAHLSSVILRAIGAAFFVLFAAWFSRAVYISVRGAPDYALFAYSLLAFCLLSWGLAFFYPFSINHWRDFLLRDLAFYAGFPAPLLLLLFMAAAKSLVSPGVRERLAHAWTRGQHRGKMLFAAAVILGFLALCAVRALDDIQDLYAQPQTSVDTLVNYYHATRSGDDTVTFASLGTLRVPHGLRIRSLKPGLRYGILFTPHSRLLIGLRPES